MKLLVRPVQLRQKVLRTGLVVDRVAARVAVLPVLLAGTSGNDLGQLLLTTAGGVNSLGYCGLGLRDVSTTGAKGRI
jgi:hypothetical protein